MILEPFARIVIAQDLPQEGLRRGDVATIVEEHRDASGRVIGFEVELFSANGETLAVASVPADAVRPGNEIWVVREGKLNIFKVRVIQRSDETAYIVSPELAAGGALVTSNITAPIEGMELRIAGAETREPETEGAAEE